MRRVRFLIVYFGPLPKWIPAYFLSCKYNPEFDWLILTDREFPDAKAYPDNVTFDYIDEDEVCRRCRDVLNIRYPRGAHPLKLTDFHPAYGLLFSDYLSGYEFWGHCDLDLVWGDISKFVDNAVLDANDIITSRRHKITGHFTLFRNCQKINSLYTGIPKFMEYCEEEKCTRMDETIISKYLNLKYNRRRHRLVNGLLFGAIRYGPRFFWDEYLAPTGKEQTEGAIEKDMVMSWNKGRTFDFNGRERMYLHFHKLKHLMERFEVEYEAEPESFVIGKEGIFGSEGDTGSRQVRRSIPERPLGER